MGDVRVGDMDTQWLVTVPSYTCLVGTMGQQQQVIYTFLIWGRTCGWKGVPVVLRLHLGSHIPQQWLMGRCIFILINFLVYCGVVRVRVPNIS